MCHQYWHSLVSTQSGECTVVLWPVLPKGATDSLGSRWRSNSSWERCPFHHGQGAAVGNALSYENNDNHFPQSTYMAVRVAVCEVPSMGQRSTVCITSYIPTICTITQPKDKKAEVQRVSIPANGKAPSSSHSRAHLHITREWDRNCQCRHQEFTN